MQDSLPTPTPIPPFESQPMEIEVSLKLKVWVTANNESLIVKYQHDFQKTARDDIRGQILNQIEAKFPNVEIENWADWETFVGFPTNAGFSVI